MMRNPLLFAALSIALIAPSHARTWTDTSGKTAEGEFVQLTGDTVQLRTAEGETMHIKLSSLSKADRDYITSRARKTKRDLIMESKRLLDQAIDAGLEKQGLGYNTALNDHMFVRRVYSDLAGRIPNYEETQAFLRSRDPNKRVALVDKLINSDDFVSHAYNWIADLIRVKSYVPDTRLRTDAFSFWLKEQIRRNRPFDEIVYQMVTAEGRIWDNPAVAYHLRDSGMKLDHVAYMTKSLLGTDITCAQCHDAPFHDWTQYEYYELAAFFADLETKTSITQRPKKVKGKVVPNPKSFYLDRKELNEYYAKKHNINTKTEEGQRKLRRYTGGFNRNYRDIIRANEMLVHAKKDASLKLPSTYEYDDAKPGSVVEPRVIFGAEAKPRSSATDRERLANWLIGRQNPRFAINLGNRLWARHFGRGVAEPLHDMKPPSECDNPELVRALQGVVLALDYDIKAITRAIVSTKAYNTLATRESVDGSQPYYFQGPLLRRMSAEQVWDSLLTLMVDDPYAYRRGSGKDYNKMINLIATGPQSIAEYEKRFSEFRSYKPEQHGLVDREGKPIGSATKGKPKKDSEEMMEMMMMRDAQKHKMTLVRASELPQPAPVGHFLRDFGQSNREFLVGASTTEGSVPQVMELMNGAATKILSDKNSLIFQKLKSEDNRFERAEIVFLSILNRRMLPEEKSMIVQELERGEDALSDLIWALLNTPEFLFIK